MLFLLLHILHCLLVVLHQTDAGTLQCCNGLFPDKWREEDIYVKLIETFTHRFLIMFTHPMICLALGLEEDLCQRTLVKHQPSDMLLYCRYVVEGSSSFFEI